MELFEGYFLRVAVLLVFLHLLTEILNWNPLDIPNFRKSLPFQPLKLYFLLFWSCWAILGRWKEFTTGRQTSNSHPFYWFSQLNMSLNIKSKYTSGKIFRSWFKWLNSNADKWFSTSERLNQCCDGFGYFRRQHPRIVADIQELQSISTCNQHLCCRQKLVHIRLVSLIGSFSFNIDENCKTARDDQLNYERVNTWSIEWFECSWSVFEPVWSRFFKTALVSKDFRVRQYHKSLLP